MPKTSAILFDLYGTLLESDSRALHRALPRALGIRPSRWLELVRNDLLVKRFDEPAELAKHICDALAPGHPPEIEAECMAIVGRELQKVTPNEGIHPLLAFLRRRGFRLGLLSNLSSSFKEPLARLELADAFDAMVFSCDEGMTKPAPAVYETLLERLGVKAEESLFIGDSLANDVEAPTKLGIRSVHVGRCAAGHECIGRVAETGWFDFEGGAGARLLEPGREIVFEGIPLKVETLTPVPDADQGRYNLVYRSTARQDDGAKRTLFFKRFLLPESAYVEEFAHRVHREIGLPACRAEVIEGSEPFLVMSEAPGRKFDGETDVNLAHEIGRHHVFAFLFSNADMRPRNAFVDVSESGAPIMTMVDLEHCFFNLAIDVSGQTDPDKPQSLDQLSEAERTRRTLKKVLSERAMRRARKTFIETETCAVELADAFRRGFIDQFERVQGGRERLMSMLLDRVYREPYLVIGTQSYRRAMGRVDVEDIAERLALDAAKALAMFC